MSDVKDLMLADAILERLQAGSRRAALQALSTALAKAAGVDPRATFDAVLLRERLSGTGMGEGVAIPHARVPGVKHPVAGFARLDPPQDFEALDGRNCDLIFMLLAPPDRGGDHLKALARASRFLRRADVREKLRGARGAAELKTLLAGGLESDAA